MPCVYHGYGHGAGYNQNTCTIKARCQQASGKPEDTTCPHAGDGEKCDIIKQNLIESHDA